MWCDKGEGSTSHASSYGHHEVVHVFFHCNEGNRYLLFLCIKHTNIEK